MLPTAVVLLAQITRVPPVFVPVAAKVINLPLSALSITYGDAVSPEIAVQLANGLVFKTFVTDTALVHLYPWYVGVTVG